MTMDREGEIADKNFSSHEEVREAITELATLGTERAAWAMHVVLRCADNCMWEGDDPDDWPNLNGELVELAIRSIAAIEDPDAIMWIGTIIDEEAANKSRPVVEDHSLRIVPATEKKRDDTTNGDLAIELLLECAKRSPEHAKESGYVIVRLIEQYPEQAISALKTMDITGLAAAIADKTETDFTKGIKPLNIIGLEALLDMHDEIKDGAKSPISAESIKIAVERNAGLMLQVEQLMNYLRGGRYIGPERGRPRGTITQILDVDEPVSADEISRLKKLFERIDASGVTDKKYANIFNDAVIAQVEMDALVQRSRDLPTGPAFD